MALVANPPERMDRIPIHSNPSELAAGMEGVVRGAEIQCMASGQVKYVHEGFLPQGMREIRCREISTVIFGCVENRLILFQLVNKTQNTLVFSLILHAIDPVLLIPKWPFLTALAPGL